MVQEVVERCSEDGGDFVGVEAGNECGFDVGDGRAGVEGRG